MVGTKEKLSEGIKVEIADNGRMPKPTFQNVEADFWKMKYLELRIELANANRGISRPVRRKDNYKTGNIAALLQQAHAHGVIEGTIKALAGGG